MRQSVFKSEQAYTEFKAQQIAQERDGAQIRDAPAASKVSMDTNHGDVEIDLDEYYNGTQNKNVDLDKVPLFMPSAENLKALSAHASSRLQELLEEYDIPTAPEQITYDNQGKMQLPDGYPYTDQLQQALEENPGLSRELRDLNSMSSVFAKMQESLPFLEAYGKAGSSAEAQKGVDQYSYLFR
ncbi:hypothetical protein D1F64_07840 [Breoghania sp. L-A4]|nr:hypothetical protein D1F64_07840 [Breoghania sp. L-A4]